ncbi:aldo/keto reductase [Dactylosporangium sp. McL0621]|uniref:aldo/keto reductase n=1 Tax=Dactylosporangium sp. McL0621 TaxID=3415678 RepID=UPI003CF767D9
MLNVNRIGLGAMRLTGGLPHADGVAIARRALELGVQFFDTADSYDFGANEELLADALHPYPEGVIVATKGGRICVGGEWFDCGRPEYLRQQAELSLRRLRVECIELYQLHRIDATVPLADQVGALRRLRDEGKVRLVGLSEVTVEQLRQAEEITPIASVQNRYNRDDRASEDVLDYCERRGIAFIPWRPVAPLADKAAALAWLLGRSPVMLPIPGTSSMRHLEENMSALT